MRWLGLLVLSTLVFAQSPLVSPGAGAGAASPLPTQPPVPRVSPSLKIADFKFQAGSPSENVGTGRQVNFPGLKFEAALANGRAAKTFSLCCALERATDEVSGDFEHRGAAMQETRFVIDEVMAKGNRYDHRLMDYNNDPTTSFRDIQKTLSVLEDRIRKRLAEEPASYAATSATSKPSISPADLEVAKRARAILDAPSKWNRADTQICPPNAQTFSLFCTYQMAGIQVQGAFDNGGPAIKEARAIIDEAPNRSKYQARLTDYNNDPTVTFEDVRKLLLLVEQRLAKRLEDAK
jgi:hypothetical protein